MIQAITFTPADRLFVVADAVAAGPFDDAALVDGAALAGAVLVGQAPIDDAVPVDEAVGTRSGSVFVSLVPPIDDASSPPRPHPAVETNTMIAKKTTKTLTEPAFLWPLDGEQDSIRKTALQAAKATRGQAARDSL